MEWIETNERFAGYFDIIGFKDLVGRNDHYLVLKKMIQIEEVVSRIKQAGVKAVERNKGIIKPTIFFDSPYAENFWETGDHHDLLTEWQRFQNEIISKGKWGKFIQNNNS